MALKPLLLKEHLALDSSQSAPQKQAAGTTLRRLLDAELRSDKCAAPSHSKSALTMLSNVIKALNSLQFFSAGSGNLANGFLQGSFSKKFRRGLWKRNGVKERDLRFLSVETVETKSFFSPSLVVSGCRSSFEGGDSACFDFMVFLTVCSTQKETVGGVGEGFCLASDDNRETKNYGKEMDCPLEEEKEQFSPVSVMEFPYKDEDYEGELQHSTSSCSQQSLTGNQTTNHPLEQFVNRAELHPVDLNHQFADIETQFDSTVHVACEAEEERRQKAISLIHEFAGGEPPPASEENLLFEFSVEGLALSEHCRNWSSGYSGEEVAAGWFSGDVVVGEECTDMVVEEMSCGLMTWLMEELVGELSAVTA